MSALSYERSGTGPPLVLVHGLGSAHSVWRPVLPALEAQYDVITVDLPGHGESPPLPEQDDASPGALAGVVAAFLDRLGLDRPHVAGNSLGGWVALELAAMNRVASVTALAPAGFWLVPRKARLGLIEVSRQLARRTSRVQPLILSRSWGRAIGMRDYTTAARHLDVSVALDAARAMATATGFEAADQGMIGTRFFRGGVTPAEIPVTIAFGDHDRILPAGSCQERRLAPAHARWVVIDNCGHVPMWDRPDMTVRLVGQTTRLAHPDRPAVS
jgi:pimeloyl-ACP methyl ester carboxylesterase